MTCEATPRVKRHDPGWCCTGNDLRIVIRARKSSPPVVCPACLVPKLLRTANGVGYVDEPYLGGDHLHIVI